MCARISAESDVKLFYFNCHLCRWVYTITLYLTHLSTLFPGWRFSMWILALHSNRRTMKITAHPAIWLALFLLRLVTYLFQRGTEPSRTIGSGRPIVHRNELSDMDFGCFWKHSNETHQAESSNSSIWRGIAASLKMGMAQSIAIQTFDEQKVKLSGKMQRIRNAVYVVKEKQITDSRKLWHVICDPWGKW